MQRLDVTVYKTDTHIIIVGQPDADDLKHNCDAMGCGREHVLYRFPLPSTTTSPVGSKLAGMFLDEAIKGGKEIEIPSLGIKINKQET